MADSMAVVDRMYECFGRGDIATLVSEVFAEDIVWRLPGHSPLSGTMNGASEVIGFFAALVNTGFYVDNVYFGLIGEDRVVETTIGHATFAGRDYEFPTCTIYTIRDARISEVQVYTANQDGVDDYLWRSAPLAKLPDRLASGARPATRSPGGNRVDDDLNGVERSLIVETFPWIASDALNAATSLISDHLNTIESRRPIDIDDLRAKAVALARIVEVSATV